MGFGGAVAAIQAIVKEQRHFVDRVIRRHVQGVQQVDLPVRAQLRQRYLRPGDDHRLAQVLQHEGERRSGERHGVGTVQDHEAVVLVVMGFNVIRDVLPVFRRHVGGVHQRLVFVDGEVRHFRTVEFRHQRKLTLQMAGDGDIAIFRALHTDGTASVGYINRFLLHGSEFLFFKRKKSPLLGKRGRFLTDVRAGQAKRVTTLWIVKGRELIAFRLHRFRSRGHRGRQVRL